MLLSQVYGLKTEALKRDFSPKQTLSTRPFVQRKVVLLSFLYLDLRLDKTSRIEILSHLAELGYDVSLIAVQSEQKYQSRNSDLHVISIPLRYVPVVSPVFFGLISFLFLPFYVIRKRPDFIIVEPSFATLGFVWKPLLSRLLKFKVILDIRTTPVGVFGFRGYLRMLQFSISVRMAKLMFDGITIITRMMKEEVCNEYNIDTRSVSVRSDGAPLSRFSCEKHVVDGSKLREKLGLTDKFVVLYHGDLGIGRGFVETVNAIAISKKKHPNIVLFLLGSGSMVPILEKLIKEKGLENNVIIHGPVEYDDVAKYIAMSNLGIVPLPDVPDWRNQCPLKLLEYLCMKKTAIITDIPAHREIVGDKKCGIYVPSCDPAEIAKAIEFAYANKEKLGEWGELGRTIVVQKYSWSKSAEDLDKYLLSIEGLPSRR